MKEIILELLGIFNPLLQLIMTTIAPVVVGIISAQLIRKLNIQDANEKAAFEAQLRDALHASAFNAVRFALTKLGVRSSADLTGSLLNDVTQEAARYVVEKNPDALKKLGVDAGALRDIIWSKIGPIPN